MNDPLSQEEYQNTMALDADQRYDYFIQQVVAHGEIWILKDALKEIWYAPSIREGWQRWRAWMRQARESGKAEQLISIKDTIGPFIG